MLIYIMQNTFNLFQYMDGVWDDAVVSTLGADAQLKPMHLLDNGFFTVQCSGTYAWEGLRWFQKSHMTLA